MQFTSAEVSQLHHTDYMQLHWIPDDVIHAETDYYICNEKLRADRRRTFDSERDADDAVGADAVGPGALVLPGVGRVELIDHRL